MPSRIKRASAFFLAIALGPACTAALGDIPGKVDLSAGGGGDDASSDAGVEPEGAGQSDGGPDDRSATGDQASEGAQGSGGSGTTDTSAGGGGGVTAGKSGAGGGGGAAAGGAGGTGGAGEGGTGGQAGNGGSGGSAGSGGTGGKSGAGGTGGDVGGGGVGGSAGSGPTDASPDAVSDPCDLDGDGFRSRSCSGGNDCDDTSKFVYPGEKDFSVDPTHVGGTSFDYDCSGLPDPQYNSVNCAGLGLLCNQTASGFLGMTAPACGQPGRFGHCKVSGLSCIEQVELLSTKMPCK